MATEYQTFNIATDQSPQETMMLLAMNLIRKRKFLKDADAAYHGQMGHGHYTTNTYMKSFRQLHSFSNNFLRMIVDCYTARLQIQGFQCADKGTNDLAWDIWTANKLDHWENLIWREAMTFGECYLMIDPSLEAEGHPRVTVESAYQMIAWQDPTDRGQNVTALKYWQAADGFVYCNLYDTQKVSKFMSPQSYYKWSEAGIISQEVIPPPQTIAWNQIDEIPHDLGVCPVVTIENAPTLTTGGVSDLEQLIPIQKGIDTLSKHALLAAEFAAFPQRYALNVAVAKDAQGKPVENQYLESALQRFWAFPPPEKPGQPPVEVGAFPSVSLANYSELLESLIKSLAEISSVPSYRLVGRMSNLSASAIIAAEAGFYDANRVKQADYSTGLDSAISLALRAEGKDVDPGAVETLWKDPSAVSGPNVAAALVALQNIGVPKEILFRMAGAGPQETEEWLKLAKEEEKERRENEPEKPNPLLNNALTELASNTEANGNSNGAESTNGESLTGSGEEP